MKRPFVFYPGSLVQQNFKEELEKGYLLINLETQETEFIQIPNEYNFQTINAPSQEDYSINWVSSLPITNKSSVRINLPFTETVETYKKLIYDDIKGLYNPEYIDFVEDNGVQNSDLQENITQQILDINSVQTIDKLIDEHAEKFGGQNIIPELKALNHDIFKIIPYEELNRITWTIKDVDFSNVFTYAENNKLTFDRSGILGVFGPNHGGKSNLLNSLFYSIFGDTYKKYSTESIINASRDFCETKVVLNSFTENSDYEIRRVLKKKGQKKRTVEFMKEGRSLKEVIEELPDDVKKDNKNEEDVRITDNKIQSQFGSFDQYQMSNFSFQGMLTTLLDLKNSQRKQEFLNFFDLDIFDKLYQESNSRWLTFKTQLKQYLNIDITGNINEKELLIKNKNKELVEVIELKGDCEALITGIQKQIESKQLKKLPVVDYSDLITSLNNTNRSNLQKIVTIDTKVNKLKFEIQSGDNYNKTSQEEIKSSEQLISVKEQLLESKQTEFNSIVISEEKYLEQSTVLKELREKLKEVVTNINKVNQEISSDTSNKLHYEKNTEILKKQQWMLQQELCSTCELAKIALSSNKKLEELNQRLKDNDLTVLSYKEIETELGFLITSVENETGLKNKKDSLANEISKIQIEINELRSKIQTKLDKIESNKLTSQNNTVEIEELSNEIIQLKQEIETNKESIKKYTEEDETTKHNKQIDLEVEELKTRIFAQQNNKDSCISKISEIQTSIKHEQKAIDDLRETLVLLQQLERNVKIHEVYTKMMHKDGITSIVLNQLLKSVEIKTNNILKLCSGLHIKFDIEGKDFDITYSDGVDEHYKDISSRSGQEGFFIGVALRVALSKINTKHRTDFFVLDEGFGVLDYDNLIKVKPLFDMLRQEFRFILIVTHLDLIKDYVDHIFTIERTMNSKFSRIV